MAPRTRTAINSIRHWRSHVPELLLPFGSPIIVNFSCNYKVFLSLCLRKLAWPGLVTAGWQAVMGCWLTLSTLYHPCSVTGPCWHEQVARKPASWAWPVRISVQLWVSFPGPWPAVSTSAFISRSGNAFPTVAFFGLSEEDMRGAKGSRGGSLRVWEPAPSGPPLLCVSHAVILAEFQSPPALFPLDGPSVTIPLNTSWWQSQDECQLCAHTQQAHLEPGHHLS